MLVEIFIALLDGLWLFGSEGEKLFVKSKPIIKFAEITPETARIIAKKYNDEGLNRALYDNSKPGKEKLLSETEKKEIIPIVCFEPSDCCARRTQELLKEEVLKRKIVKTIGHETIQLVLKESIPQMSQLFLWKTFCLCIKKKNGPKFCNDN